MNWVWVLVKNVVWKFLNKIFKDGNEIDLVLSIRAFGNFVQQIDNVVIHLIGLNVAILSFQQFPANYIQIFRISNNLGFVHKHIDQSQDFTEVVLQLIKN